MQNGEASSARAAAAARGSGPSNPSQRPSRPRSARAARGGTAGRPGPAGRRGCAASSCPASFLRVFSVPVGCCRPVTKVSESYIIKMLTEWRELEAVRAGEFLFTFSGRGNLRCFVPLGLRVVWTVTGRSAVSETVKGDDSSCLDQNSPELTVKTKMCPTMTHHDST